MGLAYNGTVSKTKTGRNCKSWERITINNERQTDQHNYCRNLHEDLNGPWCFTTDPDVLWEYCSIPLCADSDVFLEYCGVPLCVRLLTYILFGLKNAAFRYVMTLTLRQSQMVLLSHQNQKKQNCRMNQQGKNYTGKINKTRFGQKCQAWTSLVPNLHPFWIKLANDENYCRNPDTELYGPWCYTTDPGTRWEYCDIPYCEGADKPSKLTSLRFSRYTRLMPHLILHCYLKCKAKFTNQ
ncbi:Hypothetical predicted protein [Mytilus galloprovincialis]|uniref:Kringle domain-containing protein n=1 Tax=Mytilus galloprovincialis TaxID=29158 RepID=A0A8B6EYS9_MYTGA|nr:Hypothetical predicted protein [Mytilus galloprovincialis]